MGWHRGASSGLLLPCVSRRGDATSLPARLPAPGRSLHHPAPPPPLPGGQRRQRHVPRGPVSAPTVPAAQLLRLGGDDAVGRLLERDHTDPEGRDGYHRVSHRDRDVHAVFSATVRRRVGRSRRGGLTRCPRERVRRDRFSALVAQIRSSERWPAGKTPSGQMAPFKPLKALSSPRRPMCWPRSQRPTGFPRRRPSLIRAPVPRLDGLRRGYAGSVHAPWRSPAAHSWSATNARTIASQSPRAPSGA